MSFASLSLEDAYRSTTTATESTYAPYFVPRLVPMNFDHILKALVTVRGVANEANRLYRLTCMSEEALDIMTIPVLMESVLELCMKMTAAEVSGPFGIEWPVALREVSYVDRLLNILMKLRQRDSTKARVVALHVKMIDCLLPGVLSGSSGVDVLLPLVSTLLMILPLKIEVPPFDADCL